MLLTWWGETRDDDGLRRNPQQGLARMLLLLAAVPLPRIAGYIHHDDRPLSAEIVMQEKEDLALCLPRHKMCRMARLDAFRNRLNGSMMIKPCSHGRGVDISLDGLEVCCCCCHVAAC